MSTIAKRQAVAILWAILVIIRWKNSYSNLGKSLIEAINNMNFERNLMKNDLVRVHIKKMNGQMDGHMDGLNGHAKNNRAIFVCRALKWDSHDKWHN